MMFDTIKDAKRVIGVKQSTKAVEKGSAVVVYIADDAENRVVRGLVDLCRTKNIKVINIPTMAEIGKACGIEVGSAAVAVLKD